MRACVVDDLLTLPNLYGSICGITIGASQLNTKLSRILLRTVVKEIGLRSDSIDFG
jgi:hypothetical protein